MTTNEVAALRAVADFGVRFSPDIFRTQRYGGVSRYVTEVHRGLLARGVDSTITAGLHRSALLGDLSHVHGIDVDRLRPVKLRQGLTRATDNAVSRWATGRLGANDIWHASYFPQTLPRTGRFVVTVYDMIHERYPSEMSPRDLTPQVKRRACEAADLIFAISDDTAADLCQRFAIDPDRVLVTHLGVRPVEATSAPVPFDGAPFVLYVGDRTMPYKNWTGLLNALTLTDSNARLVCFGSPETAVDRRQVERRGLSGRVVYAGGSDQRLAGWYEAAAALVYPSRYEGFGLPPLEAMAHGCAVVAGRVGAIPEVVGDHGLLVEPKPPELASAIETMLGGGPVVEALRAGGPAHAARFSWQATADATLAGYQRILG
jgi:glycosyltransferase involved in cell wall biosynthesis